MQDKGFFDILFVLIIFLFIIPVNNYNPEIHNYNLDFAKIDQIALHTDSVVVDALADTTYSDGECKIYTQPIYDGNLRSYLSNFDGNIPDFPVSMDVNYINFNNTNPNDDNATYTGDININHSTQNSLFTKSYTKNYKFKKRINLFYPTPPGGYSSDFLDANQMCPNTSNYNESGGFYNTTDDFNFQVTHPGFLCNIKIKDLYDSSISLDKNGLKDGNYEWWFTSDVGRSLNEDCNDLLYCEDVDFIDNGIYQVNFEAYIKEVDGSPDENESFEIVISTNNLNIENHHCTHGGCTVNQGDFLRLTATIEHSLADANNIEYPKYDFEWEVPGDPDCSTSETNTTNITETSTINTLFCDEGDNLDLKLVVSEIKTGKQASNTIPVTIKSGGTPT